MLLKPEKKISTVALVKYGNSSHCGEQDKSFGKDLVNKMYTHMEKLATTGDLEPCKKIKDDIRE